MSRVDELANEHATWFCEAVDLVFRAAFQHGYKHGQEDAQEVKQLEAKPEVLVRGMPWKSPNEGEKISEGTLNTTTIRG